MLEIIAIIVLSSNIKLIAQGKNLKPAKYIILMVFLWIFLEFLGAIIGTIVFGEGLAAYPFALIGAALGGFLGYIIAKNATPKLNYSPPIESFGEKDLDVNHEEKNI